MHACITFVFLVICVTNGLAFFSFKHNTPIVKETSERCKLQQKLFIEGLENGDLWALKMLDSSGSKPVAIVSGNFDDMGFYDECVNIAKEVDQEYIRGKYCYAGISIPLSNSSLVLNSTNLLIGKYLKEFSNSNNTDFRIIIPKELPPLPPLQISMCIPDACVPTNIFNILGNDDWCSTNEIVLDAGDIAFLVFFATTLLFMCLSTIYDVYFQKVVNDRKSSILLSYSVYTNGRRIFDTTKSQGQISCLDGFRAMSLLWVIAGHRYFMYLYGREINKLDLYKWGRIWHAIYITQAPLAVDTFLFLTGVLLVYTFLKYMKRPGAKLNIPLLYLHRILRITPAFAVLYFFQVTIARRLSSGPVWSRYMDDMRNRCLKHWWWVALYIQNYIEPGAMCLGHTWYLSMDMQIFFLSPLILYPLIKYPRVTKMYLIPTIIAVTMLIPFVVVYVNDLRLVGPTYMTRFYYPTHTRMVPWAIGLAFGAYVFKQHEKNRKFAINKYINVAAWCTTLTVIVALLSLESEVEARNDRVEETLYMGLKRPIWSVCLCWISFACMYGYGGFINRFLSCGLFRVLGRLSYSMYLVHISVILTSTSRERTLTYFDDFEGLHKACGDIIFTFFAGLFWYLAFESPMAAVEKIIFGGYEQQKTWDVKGKSDDAKEPPAKITFIKEIT